MKKSIPVISILATTALLSGCSMMDVQEVGTTTTTYYDQTGVKTHDVSEAVMIGDKYTEYAKAAGKIADASERVETARIQGILTATAPKEGDSEAVVAWKGATATLSISQVGGNAEKAIRSLYYGKDRYDNADTAIGAGASVATTGVYTYGATKILDAAFDTAGDSTSIKTEGDGNTSTVEKSEINTETHANTTGDNSSPSVNNDASQNGTAGAASGAGATTGTIELGEDADIINACKDSHAGTTFACVNTQLGENKYSVSGNDITVNGADYLKVDAFENTL